MAKKQNTIGMSFTADTIDLKNGIKQVKDEIAKADKEFQKNTASMDKWSNNTEGLTAKLTQLNTKLDAQKRSVELYQKAIEEVSAKEGDHSVELENLQKKLVDAEIAVKRTEKEVRKYSTSLEDVQAKEKESSSSLGKLTDKIKEQEAELSDLEDAYKDTVITYGKNSKEAKALKGDIEKLSGELDDNKKIVGDAEKALDNLEDQFDDTADSADKFSDGIDGLKDLGGKVAGGLGAIVTGVGGLATAFLATAEGTKEFRTNMGKLETSFTEAGLTADDAAETYKNLYSVLGDEGQATEASTFLAKIADDEKELADMTHTLTGIYATFGAALPLEGLTEAINHSSTLGSVQGNLADALEWSGVNVDGFNEQLAECSDEEERQALIMETLSGIYDGAADTYKEVNADVIASNEAQASLSETMAAFGEKAEPILTIVKDGFNSIMQEILALMENVDFEALGEKIKSGFSYFTDTIIPAIKDGFQWIMDNKDILIAGIVGIGTAMLAWNVVSIVQGVVGAIKAWTVATEGMTVAQKLLNLAMKANPIGIVITIITSLIAVVVTLWNTNEDFRNAIINIWNKVKDGIASAINTVKTKFDEFKVKFDELKTKAKEVLDKVVEWFKSIPEKLGELKDKMLGIGKNLITGLWEGITNAKDWILKKIKGFTSDVLDGIKSFFGIHSPSREMAKIGKFLDEGLAEGLEKNKKDVLDAAEDVGDEVLDSFNYIEDELKKTKIGDKLGILNVKAGNPFEGWSIKELNAHLKEARKSLQETNNAIAANGLSQDKWTSSVEATSEYAKNLKAGYAQVSSMIDALNQKATEREELGLAPLESINTEINSLKKMLDLYKSEINEVKKYTEDASKTVKTSWVDSFEEALGISEEKMKEWSDGLGGAIEKVSGYIESAFNKIGEIGTALVDYYNQQIEQESALLDYELDKYNETKDAELAKQQELYDSGMLSEEQLAAVKAKLEKEKQDKEIETLKKKDALAKKQFNAQKATSIATTLINGAMAVVKGFADLGPIGGAINAAAQAVLTGIQVGTIASQKYVPMLAKGGVVDNPTLAMVGEAGKEVVMPLENNTQWIHELAAKISEIMSKDFSFGGNLQPVFAQAPVVNNTYNYTQNVTSPKALSRKELYRDGKNLLSLKSTN